jgi:hypothetical protein
LYVEWANRNEHRPVVPLFSLGLICAAAGAAWFVWIGRTLIAAAFQQMQQHTLMIAVLAGIVAAVAVSHQRSAHTARAARSWVAALPMSPRARLIEGLTMQLALVIAGLALISGFGLLTAATLAIARLPVGACLVAYRSIFVGALLGAVGGSAVPLPKPVFPHPGSRYVPHRALRERRPVPSVGALGIWPIRRMFAMLRPKTLSRTLLLVLVMMPLGTSAATAMIVVGLFGALTAFVFLAHSVTWVTQEARRWLKPLPISFRRLGSLVAVRGLIVMAGIGAAAAWLMWAGAE